MGDSLFWSKAFILKGIFIFLKHLNKAGVHVAFSFTSRDSPLLNVKVNGLQHLLVNLCRQKKMLPFRNKN